MFFLNLTSNLVTNSYLKSYKQFFSIKSDFLVEIKILIYIFAFEEVQSMSQLLKDVLLVETAVFPSILPLKFLNEQNKFYFVKTR